MRDPTTVTLDESRQQRLDYLEGMNRWYLFALDLAASMIHLHGETCHIRDSVRILDEAYKYLNRLYLDFNVAAFYLVNEADSSFSMARCHPEEKRESLQQLVDALIDHGRFAWALNQNRPIIIHELNDELEHPILLHVLATKSRVRGMFVGVLAHEEQVCTSDGVISLSMNSLLSIVFHNIAYALESAELYRMLDDLNRQLTLGMRSGIFRLSDKNRELEQKVTELNRSRQELFQLNHSLQQEILAREEINHLLRESEEKFRLITDSVHDAIIACDQEGKVTFWNHGAEAVFGYPASEIIGNSVILLIPPRFRPLHEYGFRKALRQEESPFGNRLVETHGLRRDGTEFPLEMSLAALGQGSERRFSIVMRDITERRLAEEKLRRAMESANAANIAKQDFLANVSHEIRTPMNAVIGMAELLAETNLDPEQRRFVQTLTTAGESLLSVINDVLDMSKIESGNLELEGKSFSLPELVETTCAIVMPRIRGKRLTLHWHLDEALPKFWLGDAMHIRQILLNLLGNAIKFTEKGEIRLEVYGGVLAATESTTDPLRLHFMVEDTGIGIPAEHHTGIFERFFQTDTSIRRRYGGTGLGLAISRRLVEAMGGAIWVESTVGVGSRFHFTLELQHCLEPVFPHMIPTTEAPVVSLPSRVTEAIRILVVEDSEDNRVLVEAYLNKSPCIVSFAFDGSQAVELFYRERFDLVLMDMQMPVMDGLEATRRMRQWEQEGRRDPTPILALTADALQEHVARSLAAGCNAHLSKPIKKKTLLEAISYWSAQGQSKE